MKTLFNQSKYAKEILGNQKFSKNIIYKPISYLYETIVDEGVLCHNLLTSELVFLEKKEYSDLHKANNEIFEKLVNQWFFVPRDFDEAALAEQFESLKSLINKMNRISKIDKFTILPTTDCNARCFYCFELGTKKKTMDKITAECVVDFIEKHRPNYKIDLRWFGGEPLYNSEAIDIICEGLIKRGIDFNSRMVTNGYLFDESLVLKAKEKWKLTETQITLDGTEKVYNRIKNYIYKEDLSPYEKVIGNVKLLLENSIAVNIRLNMDEYNTEDLINLVDDLDKEFSHYENLRLSPHLLYDETIKSRGLEAKENLMKKFIELSNHIESINKCKLLKKTKLSNNTFHCMADDETAIIILPDGKLGKCDHILDEHFIGDVFSDSIDYNEINWYKNTINPLDKCKSCKYIFLCKVLHCCTVNKFCSDTKIEMLEKKLKSVALQKYNEYRGNSNET